MSYNTGAPPAQQGGQQGGYYQQQPPPQQQQQQAGALPPPPMPGQGYPPQQQQQYQQPPPQQGNYAPQQQQQAYGYPPQQQQQQQATAPPPPPPASMNAGQQQGAYPPPQQHQQQPYQQQQAVPPPVPQQQHNQGAAFPPPPPAQGTQPPPPPQQQQQYVDPAARPPVSPNQGIPPPPQPGQQQQQYGQQQQQQYAPPYQTGGAPPARSPTTAAPPPPPPQRTGGSPVQQAGAMPPPMPQQQYQQQGTAPPPPPPQGQQQQQYPQQAASGGLPPPPPAGQQQQQQGQKQQQQQGFTPPQDLPPSSFANPQSTPPSASINTAQRGSPSQKRGGNGSFVGQQPVSPSVAPQHTGGGGSGSKRARQRPQGNQRIDSSTVPTPARDLPMEQQTGALIHQTLKTNPPLAMSNYVAYDEGSVSPKYIRPTLHAAPYQESFLRDSHLPWGALLAPLFEDLEPGEEGVSVVHGRKPVRCVRCRSYICATANFTDLGKRWTCNFCSMVNEVEGDFFCNLDSQGRRRDATEKAELGKGSVEFDVEDYEEYALKTDEGKTVPRLPGEDGRPMQHLFAIDISQAAKPTLASLVDSLRKTLRSMSTKYPMCSVSFITFGESLQFYNFSKDTMPQLVVSDVDNPFVPLPFQLLCWMKVGTQLELIESFLDRIGEIAENAEEQGCALGAVVQVANLILGGSGGKVIIASSSTANCGVGAIKCRDHHKIYGSDQEKTLFKPIDGFWPTTAVESAKKQVSFDLLLFPTEYCELVTIGQLCHLTNGSQTLLYNYDPKTDKHKITTALEKACLKGAGYGGMLRIRCSSGVRIGSYNGHFLAQDIHDMDLAGINADSTFYVEFQHESKIDPKSYAHIQAALLYTTRAGRRRVRVHTLRMPVANSFSSLFRHADLESTTHALIFNGIKTAVNKGVKASRDEVAQRLIELLVTYRKHCSSSTHTGQLLLPEQLKLMPLYCLAAWKSDALLPGTSVRIDDRIQAMFTLLSVPMNRLLFYLYPRLYAIHNFLANNQAGLPKYEGSEFPVVMPPLHQLAYDCVLSTGIYLMHDEQAQLVFLWIGSQANPKAVNILFNIEDPALIDEGTVELWHERLQAVVAQAMLTGGKLIVMHERKDTSEEAFFRNLIEDESIPGVQSYSEWLCTLHKQINAKLV